jgi:hypothetical protein
MSEPIYIHYALQTCDSASRTSEERYVPFSRAEITKKCVTSFLESVAYASKEQPNIIHVVRIFDDHSTSDTINFLKFVCTHYTKGNVTVDLVELADRGITNSIRNCYDFLRTHGKHMVYQVQDDYLFTQSGVYQMIDVFFRVRNEKNDEPMVISLNHPYYWTEIYKFKSIPRVVVPGISCYWIQLFESPCTFLTGIVQFNRHWDLYEKFFYYLETSPNNPAMEIETFNTILSRRGVLGLTPITSVALHLQHELDKDPYVDWKPIWDSIPKLI